MKTNHFVSLSFAALLLVSTSGAVLAQPQDNDHDAHHPQTEWEPGAQTDQAENGMPGMMGQGMGMNPEMMGMMHRMMRMRDNDAGMSGMGMMPGMRGMMGRGMGHGRGHPGMTRLMFILMDADGDGELSLEEVQDVTERIFNAMDADGDGSLTFEEFQSFHRETMRSPGRMQMREGMRMQDDMHMDMGEASQAYMEAMQTMMDSMAEIEMTGDPARDFALMMIPHHQAAIDKAEVLLEHSDDPELTELANEIIAEQEREIGILNTWLDQQDQ